jgi:CubicO group peptidase (beta-lactamase class C family)
MIEQVSGRPYPRFIEHRLLDPAGLDDIFYCADDVDHPGMSSFYSISPDGPVPAAPIDMSQGYSTGGLCSTADALARWTYRLHTSPPFRAELYRRMTTPERLPDGTRLSYGYGTGVGTLGDHALLFHGGAIFGADAQAVYFPDDSLAVVALSNTDGAGMMTLENRISRLLLDVPDPEPVPLTPGEMNRYVGTYRSAGPTVTIAVSDGRLTAAGLWSEDPVPLIPLGDGKFAGENRLEQIHFDGGDDAPDGFLFTHYGARIFHFDRE